MARLEQENLSYIAVAKIIITEYFMYVFDFNISSSTGKRREALVLVIPSDNIDTTIINFGEFKESLAFKLNEPVSLPNYKTRRIMLKFPNNGGY
jgi:hypothetical protein